MRPVKNLTEICAQYPGVIFSMSHTPNRGWNLRATGPYGSLSMLTPNCPLRRATLEAACQIVGCNNMERKHHA